MDPNILKNKIPPFLFHFENQQGKSEKSITIFVQYDSEQNKVWTKLKARHRGVLIFTTLFVDSFL